MSKSKLRVVIRRAIKEVQALGLPVSGIRVCSDNSVLIDTRPRAPDDQPMDETPIVL